MTSYTTNLAIALLDSNVSAPEDVVNDGFDAFDTKITGTVVCAFGGNTLGLTQDQQKAGSLFHLTVGSPGPTGACTLNLAAFGVGNFTVINDLGFTATIQISGQSLTPPTIASGQTAVFSSDGTNVRKPASGATVDASAVTYESAVSPSLVASNVAEALDDLYSMIVGTEAYAAIEFLIDGAGSPIEPGLKGYIEIPFNCTIIRGTLLGDQSGSLVVNIWKCTYSQFDAGVTHPVAGDKITASAPLTISGAVKAQDTTLTGWTKTLTKGDIIAFNIDTASPDTITRLTISLGVQKT